MIKKDLKINAISHSWNRPYLIKSMKEDFVKFVSNSKKSSEIVKCAKQVNWRSLVRLCTSEIDALMKKLEIPKNENLSGFPSSILEITLLEFIKQKIYYYIFFYLSKVNEEDIKSRKERIIRNMLHRTESEVKSSISLFEILLDVGDLKWIKDSDTLQVKLNEVQKELSKYRGQPYKPERLRLYGKILEKNDEYKKKYGKSNYSLMTKHVTKYSGRKFDNFNKALDKFMRTHKIRTSEEFKNSIYQAIVDKIPPPA